MANSAVFSEEKVGQKIDRCFSDAVIKAGKWIKRGNEKKCNFPKINNITGVGASLGIVTSLIFFKRRMWPIYGGVFFGLGSKLAISDDFIRSSSMFHFPLHSLYISLYTQNYY